MLFYSFQRQEDALRAIEAVNNIVVDSRTIKTSLGTTKYCSHFMRNQSCPKPDCMYLHDLGDQEASFTKEEMHQGKHQDYERKLVQSLHAHASTTQRYVDNLRDFYPNSNDKSRIAVAARRKVLK